MLTADEQNRFLNAFTQINTLGALGPLVDIHSNAIHQMHANPRFRPAALALSRATAVRERKLRPNKKERLIPTKETKSCCQP